MLCPVCAALSRSLADICLVYGLLGCVYTNMYIRTGKYVCVYDVKASWMTEAVTKILNSIKTKCLRFIHLSITNVNKFINRFLFWKRLHTFGRSVNFKNIQNIVLIDFFITEKWSSNINIFIIFIAYLDTFKRAIPCYFFILCS